MCAMTSCKGVWSWSVLHTCFYDILPSETCEPTYLVVIQ